MKYIKDNKFITTFALTVFFSAPFAEKLKSQPLLEGGPFLGISWYNGDLNPERQFYYVHPSFGGLIRYSANDRIGFRGSFIIGEINGNYPVKDVLLHDSDLSYTFKRPISDIAIMLEMNFFSFDHPYKQASNFTPYMSLGLGTIFYKRFEELKVVLSLPFGAGVKWKMKNGVRVGAEWTMRKSFTDDLDYVGEQGSVNPSKPLGADFSKITHNNDWVSFVGVYASFSLWNRREKCRGGYDKF